MKSRSRFVQCKHIAQYQSLDSYGRFQVAVYNLDS